MKKIKICLLIGCISVLVLAGFRFAGAMMANVDSKTDVSVPVRVPNAKFFVGNKVKVNTNVLNVRGTPSAFGKFLGAQTLGVVGDIVGGPVLATGYTWWQINYATAPSGWSAENYLDLASNLPGGSTITGLPAKSNKKKGGVAYNILNGAAQTDVSGKKFIEEALVFESYKLEKEGLSDVIKIPDFNYSSIEGEPAMPFKTVSVAIPSGFDIERVDVFGESLVLPDRYKLLLNNKPQPCCGASRVPEGVFKKSNFSYASKEVFPKEAVKVESTGYFGGYEVAELRISPFQYIPVEGKLIYRKNLNFNVIFKEKLATAGKLEKKTSNLLGNILKSAVINPGDVAVQLVGAASLSKTTGVDYLIVTAPSFVADFNKLAAHKVAKGLTTEVVSTDWIYGRYPGEDNQAKIRNAIIDYQKNRETTWVLLGGDEDVVPVRYCYSGYDNVINPPISTLQICDLYYSDVDGNWDANGNGIYGEYFGDNADFYPDVFLGRIPLGNSVDINNYIDKLITYENNSGNGGYLSRVGYTVADQMRDWGNGGQHNLIAGHLPSSLQQELTVMVEQPSGGDLAPTQVSGQNVLNELSSGYGFTFILNHGRPDGFVTRSSGYNAGSQSYLFTFPTGGDNGDLNNISNIGKYGIVYAVACDVGAFDLDKWFNPPDALSRKSVTEVFLGSENRGAVAVIANSRWGWVSASYRITEGFVDNLFYNTDANHIGVAQVLSKIDYTNSRDLKMGLNLYGDPEMEARIPIAPPSNPPVNLSITGSIEAVVSVESSWSVMATDPEGNSLTYVVVWGDGTTSTYTDVISGATQIISHRYTTQGNKTIQVTTRDVQGLTATKSFVVTVLPTQPFSTKFAIGNKIWVTAPKVQVRISPEQVKIGEKNTGDTGTIIGGPILYNPYWWWRVDYDTAPDGWSAEDWLSDVFSGLSVQIIKPGSVSGLYPGANGWAFLATGVSSGSSLVEYKVDWGDESTLESDRKPPGQYYQPTHNYTIGTYTIRISATDLTTGADGNSSMTFSVSETPLPGSKKILPFLPSDSRAGAAYKNNNLAALVSILQAIQLQLDLVSDQVKVFLGR